MEPRTLAVDKLPPPADSGLQAAVALCLGWRRVSFMQAFPYANLQRALRLLAGEGVYLGTSSWKYPGWIGSVYEEQRYLWRGKVAESRFAENCLAEYAQLFPTVCVDAAYYKFPDREGLLRLASQVPEGFRFTFKVTDDVTVRKFPKLPRFGAKGGQMNPHFLDAELFRKAFLAPCEAIREKCGMLIFEFSPFHRGDFARGRDFVAALDGFLAELPGGWDYGVEIRNRNFLHPDYFAMLAERGVAHVFNSWTDMPPLAEQWAMPGSVTHEACMGARLLLKPGRKYQEAVDSFQPYTETKEALPELRRTAAEMVMARRRMAGQNRAFIYVNNRLEGNAPRTIAAVLQMTGDLPPG